MAHDTLNLDLDRHRRCGFPEVVFGVGKTAAEVVAAACRLAKAHGQVLVTRASVEALVLPVTVTSQNLRLAPPMSRWPRRPPSLWRRVG